MDQLRDTLQGTLGQAYVLERELGGGGMSRVFVARESALDRQVVVKVLLAELAAGVNADRFRREILLAARLQHPHIVPLLTAGDAAGLAYFTMPFIDGESLRATLLRTGELPIATAIRYLRDVASALAYAHANGVVHRDIKPDNVLISGGSATVTDFGVAKALTAASAQPASGQLTGLGIALGTPAYMAPEQAAADPATDARADVYSFGAMAYELVTGQPPFTGRPAQALLAAHAVEIPEAVDRRRPAIPPRLAALIMQCLEKRPADRPQTAAALVEILDAIPVTPGMTGATAAYPSTSSPVGTSRSTGGRRDWRHGVVVPLAAIGAATVIAASVAIMRSHFGGASSAAPVEPKLVVLPFQNEGPSADAYFTEGLTEAITNRLSSLHNLGVIDPRSANQYKDTKESPKQIGRELGVQYVLEGSVRWASGAGGTPEVQISPTLVNTADETTKLAPGPYVVQPSDVFTVQTDVATKVADALGVVLGQSDQRALTKRVTAVPAAYDAYLRGRDIEKRLESQNSLDPTLLRSAMSQFERATTLDPRFALAFAELGGDRIVWSILDPGDVARQKAARNAIDSALELDPNLPEGHVARARFIQAFEHDASAAYEELVRAQAERPSDAKLLRQLGGAQVEMGRGDEGITNLERAAQLDPRSGDALAAAARANFNYRRYGQAQSYADRLMALSPQDWAGYGLAMDIASEGRGDTAAARVILQRERAHILGATAAMIVGEEGTQGASDWAHLDSLQLADVHPLQVFDTVNFYFMKMDLYMRQHRSTIARAYADTSLTIVGRHSFTGPLEPAAHALNAVAGAICGRRALSLQGIAQTKQDIHSLGTQNTAITAQSLEALATAYTQLGEADSAVAELTQLLALPSGKSAAYLRIDPEWDPLRSNSGFQRLVNTGH